MSVDVGPHDFFPLRPWSALSNEGACRSCYLAKKAHPVRGWTAARPIPGPWPVSLVGAVLVVLIGLLVLASAARADVRVAVVPDDAISEPLAADAYTITYASDQAASIAPWFKLPGHGLPCDQGDTLGEPIGNDPDTNFLVTTPGVLVASRIVTWPDTYQVAPGAPLVLRLGVIMPPLGGCFYAGASATTSQPVVGLARGAQIFNDQASTSLATGGSATCPDAASTTCTLDWWFTNNTPTPVTLGMERLGARDGFGLVSDNLAGDPLVSLLSVMWTWREPMLLAAGETQHRSVTLTRPCGISAALLRLHVESADGLLVAGTGDGVRVKKAAC